MQKCSQRTKGSGLLACLLAAFLLFISFPAHAGYNHKYASIVIEADTGYVLHESRADKQLHPASLTKMMTLYLTFDAIKAGKLKKNQRIYISANAAREPPSKLGLKVGSTIKVEDAILALVTKSANDVATALGEAIGGSEARFARMMTAKARQLGMDKTTFKNAHGLHHRYQVSTARDMARLSQALIRHHPEEYKYFSTNTFYYQGKAYNNHNHLMASYNGMDGIKTGYISAAGFNLAASAERNGTRLIGVVFGGRSSRTRNAHMKKLLDNAFSKVTDIRMARLSNTPPAPVRKPDSVIAQAHSGNATVIAANNSSATRYAMARNADRPAFDAIGLVIGEGDAEIENIGSTQAQQGSNTGRFQPRFLNDQPISRVTTPLQYQTVSAQSFAKRTDWSVQIGAFSTEHAGVRALETARAQLPGHFQQRTENLLVPLVTNRGVIYRARIAGLDQKKADDACKIIQGNCLVLAAQ